MTKQVVSCSVEWVSVPDLARQKGVSRQALHKTVRRLIAQGLRTKLGPAGTTMVDGAAFQRLSTLSVDAVRSANGRRSNAQKQPPAIFDNLPGQAAGVRFVALDEIAPAVAELLDDQAAILDRLRDRSAEIAAAGSPEAIEAELVGLWREMRDEMLAATEACGLPFVEVVP